ncbi:MAG: putative selenate reductase subunit YgfK [Sphaerochaetaceae bacterium]|nr:putative selenate reductase subunit YgfK [Sphaerochaetaceae bacterium]
MGDRMRPVPFLELLSRMFGEYKKDGSMFGYSENLWFADDRKLNARIFSQGCSMPLGPAAGPHTQLAQNIITSYLAGARFFELKTVQIMDSLEIEKPCIDARDEGYNVEWSTEYTLPKAFDEYLKAWIIVSFLDALTHKGEPDGDSFIFNMSVGYNLEGIKSPKMQTFIDSMMDASRSPLFETYIQDLSIMIRDGEMLEGTPWEKLGKKLEALPSRISSHICSQVTLSTMHGCPPTEIEAICSYMLKEKGIDTFVKLNPTLLGYDEVRSILDETGFGYVSLKRETFEKDLQYADAIQMLSRLLKLAGKQGRCFGVKLTNTLGSANDQGFLPGSEMYMSGRALLPISTTVASRLSSEFDGKLPISYSGGANYYTIGDLFEAGIKPITVATDMLKPGGYGRLAQMAGLLASRKASFRTTEVDVKAITDLALNARNAIYQQKAFRGTSKVSTGQKLDLFDCFEAPCQAACPIHQDIPDYVSFTSEGKYAEALSLIYMDNTLPGMTCSICDHKCQDNCARMDYEGCSVQIRAMKKKAFEKGRAEYMRHFEDLDEPSETKAAVIGAGPAGLSAASFLARAGFDVTILEKEDSAGGVVAHVIPSFRIKEEKYLKDIEFVLRQGVKIVYGVTLSQVSKLSLQKQGFKYLFYAIGCTRSNSLGIEGENVLGSLQFLQAYRKNPDSMNLGKNVVVCGGGNTAMDSARSAKRSFGVESVTVVYRRTADQMPAAREEYELALSEGIKFMFLANPKSFKGTDLELAVMELGDKDASGRPRPVDTGKTITIQADTLISAIGESSDASLLKALGLEADDKGRVELDESFMTKEENVYVIGDMAKGPATIVKAIASARAAVENAIDRELDSIASDDDDDDDECECSCGHDHHDHDCSCHDEECHCHDDEEEEEEEEVDIDAENRFFDQIRVKKANLRPVLDSKDPGFEENEGKRCMDCSYYCCKCVEVCPNRANVAIDVRELGIFDDAFQILHLDAFCNECGNCASFCNHEGRPYKDKLTLFSRMDDFLDSENTGFVLDEENRIHVRYENKTYVGDFCNDSVVLDSEVPDEIVKMIEIVVSDYPYLLGSVEE